MASTRVARPRMIGPPGRPSANSPGGLSRDPPDPGIQSSSDEARGSVESRRDPVLTVYETRVGIPFEAPPTNPVPGADSIAPESGSWLDPHRPRESPRERVCKSNRLWLTAAIVAA